jgi:hypothetical protein
MVPLSQKSAAPVSFPRDNTSKMKRQQNILRVDWTDLKKLMFGCVPLCCAWVTQWASQTSVRLRVACMASSDTRITEDISLVMLPPQYRKLAYFLFVQHM